MFMSVDFPEPDGPMMATKSPFSISSETPRSAWTSCSPMMYVFVMFRIAMVIGVDHVSALWRRRSAPYVATGAECLTRPVLLRRNCYVSGLQPACNLSQLAVGDTSRHYFTHTL